MNAAEKLIEILESLGFPTFRQGSLGEDEDYPQTFFTYWNNETNGGAFYDNENHTEIYDFDVNVYSDNPKVVYDKLAEAKKVLKENGFTIYESGHDVASDVNTHIGRGINVLNISQLEN